MKLKKGDIIFFKSNSFFSRMIRLVESAKKSQNIPHHVAIVTGIYANKIAIIEATLKGVKVSSLSIYDNNRIWFGRLKEPIGKKDMDKILVWLNSQIDIPYDYTALVGIFFRSFFRLLGPKIYKKVRFVRNFLDSRTRFFCSELVSMGYSIVDVHLWHAHLSLTTPYDLFRSDKLEIWEE